MKRLILALPSLLILSACAGTGTTTPADQISYTCSDNKIYSVSLSQDKNDAELLELTLPDGKKATLVNVIAASGAKYVGGIYGWWEKGNEATFSNLDTSLECRQVQK